MRASTAAYDLIRHYEGLRLQAYPDPGTGGKPWTIGYGHTGPDVYPGLRIDKAQAEAWLEADVAEAENIVNGAVKVPLSQSQFDALTSFCFNCGYGVKGKRSGFVVLKNGKPSTLLIKINAGKFAQVPAEMARWNKGGGKELDGLVLRRAAEGTLWASDGAKKAELSDAVLPMPDAPIVKPMAESRTMQGAAISSVGTIGAVVTETAQQLAPATETFDALKYVFAILILVGVALTIYGRLRIARDEGV